jgi:AraC-like DNA-binding protein
MLLDLRHAWQTEVRAPFDNVHLNVTQASLDELAEECESGAVEIDLPPFATYSDQTLRHLALSLVPAFRRPVELSSLFAEHIAIAAALHLVQTYGGTRNAARRLAAGLAMWQERRAREYVHAHLDTDIGLRILATECGLSPAHFAKAFKRTVGMPPHRWLIKQRVERACDLLLHSGEPLEAIALACGFADQSHMTRVFTKAVGTPPGAWRRARRS